MRPSWIFVSVVSHAGAMLAAVIAPLLAAGTVPEVRRPIAAYIRVQLPQNIPAAVSRPPELAPAVHRQVKPGAAPLEAPDGVAPERHAPRQTAGLAVEGGLDPDLGSGLPLGIEIGDALGPPPPPEPPRVVAPVRVGGLIREPRRIAYVSPVYPLIAQAARLEGDVVLEAIIGTDGIVQDLRVVRSSPLLDEAAVEAVRQWRYTPTLLNGTPVPVVMTVRVSFRLR